MNDKPITKNLSLKEEDDFRTDKWMKSRVKCIKAQTMRSKRVIYASTCHKVTRELTFT